jgi:hypothetical protein
MVIALSVRLSKEVLFHRNEEGCLRVFMQDVPNEGKVCIIALAELLKNQLIKSFQFFVHIYTVSHWYPTCIAVFFLYSNWPVILLELSLLSMEA